MFFALPRLISAGAAAAMLVAPGIVSAQAPGRYLPPVLTMEAPEASLECLALAITYEAGIEPVAGQEAVAQVILNRVGQASYPDTVCGVVWQGAERRSGCQFTFTCDGSLQRQRSGAEMQAARQVAVRVLAGQTADHTQGATHYHASYVSPYWAPSLTRVRQIATHIFYRSPGKVRNMDGAPVIVTLAGERPPIQVPETADAVIKNGEFAPWGLIVGKPRR